MLCLYIAYILCIYYIHTHMYFIYIIYIYIYIYIIYYNSCINLIITKYKLKSQYVKLAQLWPLTVNCVKVSSQSYRPELP